MASEPESFKACESCGATVYPEHIEKKMAGDFDGKLLCHHCLTEQRGRAGAAETEDRIKLADIDSPAGTSSRVRSFGGSPTGMSDSIVGAVMQQHTDFRRPLQTGVPAATRCRTFHAKLTDAALSYMNDQINAWVDESDDIEVKFATSTIGVVEGKHADPHLIITLFY